MGSQFEKVTDTQALDRLTEQSKKSPVIIFKHSLTCPISAAAFDQMEVVEGAVTLIEVQKARELSNAIESRLGVPHESPQVIVIRNGQVVWNASHFKITAEAVAKAVSEAKTATQAD